MKASTVAQQIERLGFRRWYERQLIESHAYLVTAFLALIVLLAGFEAMRELRGMPVYYVALIVTAGGAGTLMWITWRRFTTLLARAELFAESATCPQCRVWGKFRIVGSEAEAVDDPPEAGRPHWLRVRCTRCTQTWRLG